MQNVRGCGIAEAEVTYHVTMNKLGPEVQVESGIVRGSERDERGVLAFKGIPYAAAPVGDLRWHAPEAAPAWEGVRDATQYGTRCLSAWPGDVTPGPPRSEDSLSYQHLDGGATIR